jgi:hypothetical protein
MVFSDLKMSVCISVCFFVLCNRLVSSSTVIYYPVFSQKSVYPVKINSVNLTVYGDKADNEIAVVVAVG